MPEECLRMPKNASECQGRTPVAPGDPRHRPVILCPLPRHSRDGSSAESALQPLLSLCVCPSAKELQVPRYFTILRTGLYTVQACTALRSLVYYSISVPTVRYLVLVPCPRTLCSSSVPALTRKYPHSFLHASHPPHSSSLLSSSPHPPCTTFLAFTLRCPSVTLHSHARSRLHHSHRLTPTGEHVNIYSSYPSISLSDSLFLRPSQIVPNLNPTPNLPPLVPFASLCTRYYSLIAMWW